MSILPPKYKMAVIPEACSNTISPAVSTKAASIPGALVSDGRCSTDFAIDPRFLESSRESYPSSLLQNTDSDTVYEIMPCV